MPQLQDKYRCSQQKRDSVRRDERYVGNHQSIDKPEKCTERENADPTHGYVRGGACRPRPIDLRQQSECRAECGGKTDGRCKNQICPQTIGLRERALCRTRWQSHAMIKTEFVDLALRNRFSHIILDRLEILGAPDCWLVSGALFQPVWNALTNRAPEYGITDYDVLYFDNDTSWEAEDRIIKGAAGLFGDLGVAVEVGNQARVRLFYENNFDTPY